MKLATLLDLYVDQLQDMHSAEKQMTKALPKMVKAASSTELKGALTEHLAITKEHVMRLDTILSGLDRTRGRKVCEAAVGLVAEGSQMIGADAQDEIRDAGLIVAAQKAEHYEIASYGSLRAFAVLLGRGADARLLGQTLAEEREADERLTQVATNVVNTKAMA